MVKEDLGILPLLMLLQCDQKVAVMAFSPPYEIKSNRLPSPPTPPKCDLCGAFLFYRTSSMKSPINNTQISYKIKKNQPNA